ncbi:MAG: 8-amino-7-oxononanoate synthase [Leptolyngbya sp. LCM1.Bin17]|nr:MAG: 8-amino-7-oxononanoate synthase [Leptolyngbya sp. LCM1.Bin17]
MGTTPYDWLDKSLAALHRAHRYRSVQAIDGMAGPTIQRQGQTLVNFASNDYLGLASDPRLAAAAIAAIHTYGTGSTGSRLLSGHRELHRELEQAIAALKGTDDAIVFSSGYLANLGAIAALVGTPDLVLGDEYNHSSLKTGAKASGAAALDYHHSDMAHLKALLEQHRDRHRRCLITTDSVFSMDGDLCPLPEILELAETYNAMVLVDEAHGTGVFGTNGSGVVAHLGCAGRPLITVGTLSKALGSLGGYVTGSQTLIDFLRNRAPGWIYTTGLTPAATAAALAAVHIIQQEPDRRRTLWQNVALVSQGLDRLFGAAAPPQLKPLPSASPIISLEGSSARAVLTASQQLQQAGLWVPAVRPPTVPSSRLRITLMATHQSHQVDQLIQALSATATIAV